MAKKKKQGKSPRSKPLQVRLDPRIKLGAEFAARIQHRSLSSFVEDAVARYIREIKMAPEDFLGGAVEHPTCAEFANFVWHRDDVRTFLNVACSHYSMSLSFEDTLLWKVVGDRYGFGWSTMWVEQNLLPPPGRDIDESSVFERDVRRNWKELRLVADGELSLDDLPPVPKDIWKEGDSSE